jgi:probable phosphoglycerate mutase
MMITSCLDLPIDRFQSFVAEPASLTIINLEKSKSTILQSNYKLTVNGIRKFKSNQIGGGNSLVPLRQWWWK